MNRTILLLTVVLLTALVATASAGLIVDVRADSVVSGPAVVLGPKEVQVPPTYNPADPAVIKYGIYAYFSPTDGGDDELQSITNGLNTMRDATTYGFKGNISPVTLASPFNAAGSWQGDVMTNSNGDQYIPLDQDSGWTGRAASMQTSIPAGSPGQGGVLMGTFTVTQTGMGSDPLMATLLNASDGGWGVHIDNGTLWGYTVAGENTKAGAPVSIVGIPEPSSFLLLGMGVLALLAIRRRK
jgi:hypothetical protein